MEGSSSSVVSSSSSSNINNSSARRSSRESSFSREVVAAAPAAVVEIGNTSPRSTSSERHHQHQQHFETTTTEEQSDEIVEGSQASPKDGSHLPRDSRFANEQEGGTSETSGSEFQKQGSAHHQQQHSQQISAESQVQSRGAVCDQTIVDLTSTVGPTTTIASTTEYSHMQHGSVVLSSGNVPVENLSSPFGSNISQHSVSGGNVGVTATWGNASISNEHKQPPVVPAVSVASTSTPGTSFVPVSVASTPGTSFVPVSVASTPGTSFVPSSYVSVQPMHVKMQEAGAHAAGATFSSTSATTVQGYGISSTPAVTSSMTSSQHVFPSTSQYFSVSAVNPLAPAVSVGGSVQNPSGTVYTSGGKASSSSAQHSFIYQQQRPEISSGVDVSQQQPVMMKSTSGGDTTILAGGPVVHTVAGHSAVSGSMMTGQHHAAMQFVNASGRSPAFTSAMIPGTRGTSCGTTETVKSGMVESQLYTTGSRHGRWVTTPDSLVIEELVKSGAYQVVNEKIVEREVRVSKRVTREDEWETVVIIPQKELTEDIVDDLQMVREKIVEVARIGEQKIIEVPEIEYVERIVEVPEKIIQEKIIEVPKIQIMERVVEVPSMVVQERIVEVPEIEYKEVLVEKIIEIPQVVEEVKIREVPVPQYIEKPIPQYTEVPDRYEVTRNIPVPVEVETTWKYQLKKLKPRFTKVKVPYYVPRFVEIPVPQELMGDIMEAEANALAQHVEAISQQAAISLCEVENVAASIKNSEFRAKIEAKDYSEVLKEAWKTSTMSVRHMENQLHTARLSARNLQKSKKTTGTVVASERSPGLAVESKKQDKKDKVSKKAVKDASRRHTQQSQFSQQKQQRVNTTTTHLQNPHHTHQTHHQVQHQIHHQGQHQILQGQHQIHHQAQHQIHHQGQHQIHHQGQHQIHHQTQNQTHRQTYHQTHQMPHTSPVVTVHPHSSEQYRPAAVALLNEINHSQQHRRLESLQGAPFVPAV